MAARETSRVPAAAGTWCPGAGVPAAATTVAERISAALAVSFFAALLAPGALAFQDPETWEFSLFGAKASLDSTAASDIIKKISTYMVKDLPVIPITESVDWFQYNDTDIF